jgi:hypothetical protein
MPFNIALPWGESIAQYIGTTLAELKTNLPLDPTLEGMVGSTCAMVRDMAIKELVLKNSKAGISLSDICYGVGYVMHEGAMVSTGACANKRINTKGEAILLGDGTNSFANFCEKKEGDIFVKLRKYFGPAGMVPMTALERLKHYNKLGMHNTTGLGAIDYVPEEPAFVQKNKQSTNDELPNYNNSSLSGKGFTYNTAPINRYESKSNKQIFHPQGYSERPEDAPEAAAADEEEALGGSTLKVPIKNFDQLKLVTKLEIPDYVCTMICAGLNIEDLLDGQGPAEPKEEPPVDKTPQLNNPNMNTEEGMHINTYR